MCFPDGEIAAGAPFNIRRAGVLVRTSDGCSQRGAVDRVVDRALRGFTRANVADFEGLLHLAGADYSGGAPRCLLCRRLSCPRNARARKAGAGQSAFWLRSVSSILSMKAGRSPGFRDEMKLPSVTTSSSR